MIRFLCFAACLLGLLTSVDASADWTCRTTVTAVVRGQKLRHVVHGNGVAKERPESERRSKVEAAKALHVKAVSLGKTLHDMVEVPLPSGKLEETTCHETTTITDMATGKPMKVPVGLKWNPGTTSPVKITDPSASGELWTCRGAIYFRLRFGEDLSPVDEFVSEKHGMAGPETAASSELTRILIERVRAKSNHLFGVKDSFVLDTRGGSNNATPVRCWQKTKKRQPDDWRGPTPW